MLSYILTAIVSLLNGTASLSQKAWQRKTSGLSNNTNLFLIIMSACSMLIFSAMSGFDLRVNAVTVFYALLYAADALISVSLTFIAISRMNLITYSVFTSCKTVLVWAFGILFLNERASPSSIVSAVLFTVSVLLPLVNVRGGKTKLSGYFIGLASTFVGAFGTLLLKFYAKSPQKSADSVLCFYTNAFILLALLLFTLFSTESRPKLKEFSGVKYVFLFIPLYTIASNVSSVIQLSILKIMPVSHFSVLIAALDCIAVFINSKVIFRESCKALDVCCLILSTAAVIISVL